MAEAKPNLTGRLVTEVGLRQAWPFLNFACSDAAGINEVRLFIDTTFDVGSRSVRNMDSPMAMLSPLAALVNLTVTETSVNDIGVLSIVFDDGSVLEISGAPTASTTGPPWWTGPVA
jgi:hypothetical protein